MIDVEGLETEACFEAIKKSITKTLLQAKRSIGEGQNVQDIDWAPGSVTVTFSGRAMAIKNVEYAIADAGFKANDVEARGEPPEGCGAAKSVP